MANLAQAYAIGRAIAVVEATLSKSQKLPKDFVAICMNNPMQKLTPFLGDMVSNGWRMDLMTEIMDSISPDGLPPRLLLEEQSRAWVGYYHQRKSLYEKNGI